jgi:hypothetical protein
MPIRPVNRRRMQQDLIDNSLELKKRMADIQGDPNNVLTTLSDDLARRATIDGFIAAP